MNSLKENPKIAGYARLLALQTWDTLQVAKSVGGQELMEELMTTMFQAILTGYDVAGGNVIVFLDKLLQKELEHELKNSDPLQERSF